MAFVEPVILSDRGIRIEPLALEHEAGLRAAAADGELWQTSELVAALAHRRDHRLGRPQRLFAHAALADSAAAAAS